jgi:hypothetical protein
MNPATDPDSELLPGGLRPLPVSSQVVRVEEHRVSVMLLRTPAAVTPEK